MIILIIGVIVLHFKFVFSSSHTLKEMVLRIKKRKKNS